VSGYFVPAVIAIAVITFVIWSIVGPAPAMAYALVNAVSVLIIACPCALGLATPMSIMVGVGRAAQTGILIKNAEAIENAEKVTISEELKNEARRLQEKAQTTVWLAVDGEAVGILGVADPIKETARQAIRQLHDMHLKVIMCTGDNRRTAEAVARELGIDEFRAEVMPNEKIDIGKKLKSEGAIVAMAGDGINDAPALAAADVGVAMGTGTD